MNAQEISITHSALGWVKKSIDDNLSDIESDLKQFIDSEELSLLESVKQRLGMIQGVLVMIEQYGAAMLTEEMLALADFIASGKHEKSDQALEVLLRAVLQLPDYLEHIQAGHRDIPMAILPLLNDIRAVRNQDLFSEKLLFLPDLSMHEQGAESEAIDNDHNQASRLLVKKLRPVYQLALVNVIREKNVEGSLKRLEKVCETLEERSVSEQIARIWWIVGALIESVSRQQLELGVSIKNLLGKVDALFRVILIIGERGLLQRQPIELIKNFLFYIAQPDCDGPKAQAIKTAYRLEQFLPSESARSEALSNIAGPNQALLRTVAEAMKAEIETLKSTLEVYVNGDLTQVEVLKDLPQEMHIISDTLAMIGLGAQRQLIESQIEVVKQVLAGERVVDEEQLLSMAAELLQVEQALEQMPKRQPQTEPPRSEADVSRDYELDSVLAAVVSAALDDIQKTKDAILEFVKDPEHEDNIELSINLIQEARGALVLLERDRAVRVVDGLTAYLQGYDVDSFVDAERLDSLSQVVASLEYYLEALGEHRHDADGILDLADTQLRGLLAGLKQAPSRAPGVAAGSQTWPQPAPVLELVDPDAEVAAPAEELAPAGEGAVTERSGAAVEEKIEETQVPQPEQTAAEEHQDTQVLRPVQPEAEEHQDTQVLRPVQPEAEEHQDTQVLRPEQPEAEEHQDTQVLRPEQPEAEEHQDTQVLRPEQPEAEEHQDTQVLRSVQPAAEEHQDTQVLRAQPGVDAAPTGSSSKTAGRGRLEIEAVEEELEVLKAGSDQEILEIYLEEAEEESVNIARLQKDWMLHPEDDNAVKNIRRAFHTIKGSGRLVGALKIGEFAWDFEQLLNRVIDKTVPPNRKVIEAVGNAAQALPELVEELKTSTRPQADIGYLRGLARALAEFKTDELLLDHTQTLTAIESPYDHITNADADEDEAEDFGFGNTTQIISDDVDLPPQAADVQRAQSESQALPEQGAASSGAYDDTLLTSSPPIALDDEVHPLEAETRADDTGAAQARAAAADRQKGDYSKTVPEFADADVDDSGAGPDAAQADPQTTRQQPAGKVGVYEETVLTEAPPIASDDERRQLEAETRARLAEAARARADASYQRAIDYTRPRPEPADDDVQPPDAAKIRIESVGDDFIGEGMAFGTESEIDPSLVLSDLDEDEEGAEDVTTSSPEEDESEEIAMSWPEEEEAEEITMSSPEEDEAEEITMSSPEEDEAEEITRSSPEEDEAEEITTSSPEEEEAEEIAMSSPEEDEAEEITMSSPEEEEAEEITMSSREENDSEEITMSMPQAASTQASAFGPLESASDELEFEDLSGFSGIDFSGVDDEPALPPHADEPSGTVAGQRQEGPSDPFGPTTSNPEPGVETEVSESRVREPEEQTGLSFDPDLLIIYQQEVEQHLGTVSSALDRAEATGELVPGEEIYRALHTIHGASRTADISSIGELAGLLEKPLKSAIAQNMALDQEIVALYREGQRALQEMTAELVETRKLPFIPANLEISLRALAEDFEEYTVDLSDEGAGQGGDFIDTLTMMNESVESDQDNELLEIFIDEANELLEMSDNTLHQWAEQQHSEPDAQDYGAVMELQRYLHTLKGGARMAELKEISDLSHEMESLFIAVIDGRVEKSDSVVELLKNAFDLLHRQVTDAQQGAELSGSASMVEALRRQRHGEDKSMRDDLAEETPGYAVDSENIDIVSENLPGEPVSGMDRAAQDVIKVRADLLDNLVSSAGEVSIYRARMEQQVAGIGSHLGELGQTIARLKSQLRSLEAETDAQIHFSHRAESTRSGEFDPLEMDRYTMIQELSRSLGESVNDLSSLQAMLGEQVRDSETLLLQQSRVSSDLQDGLIKSRMVRFSGLLSRLRRLVRQSSQELGKKAELVVTGEQHEVDNKVLDHMVAPLEHIIRNALSHGIETPFERVRKGKPELGRIAIDITRDGADVVIKVSDDGAGVDIEKVRSRALQLGLLEQGRVASDADLVQYILEPGFSTAEHVTQLSGRGVGMDVVDIEVKQLGGTLQIETTPQGTTFIARLPFTLSINQAILVRCGEETYAIPLLNIEGITRIDAQQMHAYYREQAPELEYAGQRFWLHNLAKLVGAESPFRAGTDSGKQAVILCRAGDVRAALHVDEIIGNREIVVKSLGKQLSQVKSLSGASILADGSVVLILDIGGLMRQSVSSAVKVVYHARVEQAGKLRKTVMVVDDSITMRRIASKLLERHNYQVVTAKDGVDALAQLQDVQPDVMLLDIEMPRMDGFELATHMQNEVSYAEIPIIMITSRTGEKHRDRAFEIGVANYMGKPYQEEELIQNIQSALAGR
jgi:chemosensory pili system protein ChpA (sensor histidine kinase/response regulator)